MNNWRDRITVEYRDPYFILFCLLIIASPLSSGIFFGIITVLFIYWVWQKGYRQLQAGVKKRRLAQFFIVLAILEGIGFFYTENVKGGLRELEKLSFPLPMIVMFAGTLTITEKRRRAALMVFTGIMTTLMLVCYVRAVYVTGNLYPDYDPDTFLYAREFARSTYTEIINCHPGYLSLALLLVIVFLLQEVLDWREKGRASIIAGIAIIFFSIMNLIILSSKVHIVLLIVVLVIFILRQLLQVPGQMVKIITLGAGSAIVLLVAYLIISDGQIRYRFVNEMPQTLEQKEQQWKAALSVWWEHPWLGVGMGDRQTELDKAYVQFGFKENVGRNSHNQFLDIQVSLGIVGMVWLLALMATWFLRSIRDKDLCFFLFNVIFFASCLTESVLHRFFGFSMFILFSIIFTFKKENADQ